MVEKCPARYKNLNYIQSFSEQGYATIQLMQQACMNDEWLRQRILKLNYLTSPAVRKWYGKSFKNWIDSTVSYGYKVNSNGTIGFSKSIHKLITVDFVNDEDKIDLDKTDASIVAFDKNSNKVVEGAVPEDQVDLSTIKTNAEEAEKNYDSDGQELDIDFKLDGSVVSIEDGEVLGVVPGSVEHEEDIVHRCQLPFENEADKYTYKTDQITQKAQKAEYNLTSRTIKKNQGCNSSWYVGFNKSKKYYVRPDWLKTPNGWKDLEIPSVARGQTFKATATGWLDSIDLKLNYSGTKSSDCGSPLYVQIWSTTTASRPKSVWNRTSNTMDYVYKRNKNNKGDYNLVNAGQYVVSKSHTGLYNLVNGSYVYTPNSDGKYDLVGRKFKQVKKGTGKYSRVYEKTIVPDTKKSGIYKPLTTAIYDPSKMKAFDLVNIEFDKPVKLDKGKSYFIALFSPLSEYKHCPFWGGWGRNCSKDKKYEYGHAFLSEDNGRSWIRYGREDSKVQYKEGRYVPQDFAFQCHIRTKDKLDEEHEEKIEVEEGVVDDAGPDNPRYLYLKPIFDNPITHVRITANDEGSNYGDYETKGIGISYDFKTNHMSDWEEDITLEQTYKITPNDEGEYPNILHVRARLYRDITTIDESVNRQKWRKATPFIETLSVEIDTQLPKEMYVRTVEYKPPLGDNILGASIWGRLYSKFDMDPTVTCTAEIVTNEQPTDHFKIIEIENVKEYAEKKGLSSDVVSTLTNIINSATGSINDSLCAYLSNNTEIIDELKKKNVYVKPYEKGDYMYLLSFVKPNSEDNKVLVTDYKNSSLGGIQFSNNVAYPIRECTLTPDNSSMNPTSFSEWHDYEFDYENNILTFKKDVLDKLITGDIGVKYNKVFISGLTKDEVGIRVDASTGLREEGLILDYFKETYLIDDTHLESRRVKLRVEPVDPIREVVLNRDTENEVELYEGYDYEVDIENNELEFIVNNTDKVSTVLSRGDILEVVYTPNLNANGLSVGYWARRTNTDKDVYIGASYWEYKS